MSEIFEPWEARDLAGPLRLIAIHPDTDQAAAAALMRYLYTNPLAPARQAQQITAQLRTAADRLTTIPDTKDETR